MTEPLGGETVRVPSEVTVAEYGRLLMVMPLTPRAPVTLLVQVLLSKVCAVTDSVAVPGAAGLAVTLAVNWGAGALHTAGAGRAG